MGSRRFSVLVVLFSLLGGIITFILGELLFLQQEKWPEYVLIGLYFGLGAVVISGMVVLAQMISPSLVGYTWKSRYLSTSFKLFIPSTFIMVGLAALLLQFLYGVEIGKGKEIKDIIIAVDTSGSMNETDPNNDRFRAIEELIDGMEQDKRVALITFDDAPQLVFDFTALDNDTGRADVREALSLLANSDGGQTQVKEMMDYAYALIEKESMSNRASSLILLSDGEPTDDSRDDVPRLVEKFSSDNIPIYTIGMMYKTAQTEEFLQNLSDYTGGKHFSTSHIGMLKDTFEKIRYYQDSRSLLGERVGSSRFSWLFGIVRILLLTVIGGLIALGQGFIFDNRFLAKGLIIGGMIGAFLGSLAVELLLRKYMSPILARGMFLIIFSLCLPMFTWAAQFKDSYHGTLKA